VTLRPPCERASHATVVNPSNWRAGFRCGSGRLSVFVRVTPGSSAGGAAPTVSHTAKASWYGPGLAGQKTTSGEPYNPEALTAASKTLPLGSVVKVTNPENGKSVKVRINDRGPFVPGRSLDLSKRAAERIGIVHRGVARVKVSKSPATPAPAQDLETDSGPP
jgi:peptidoglycan lytic transglycosylase